MRGYVLCAGLTAMTLAGCSDSGLTQAEMDYNAMADANNVLADRVAAMDLSTSVDMPTVGTATYEGYSTLLLDTPVDSALVGDATITANFGTGTLNGTLNNFIGSVNGGETQDFSGSLGIKEGEIGTASASSLEAGLKGQLSGGGDVVNVNGGIQGNFRSDDVNAQALNARSTGDTDFLLNGQDVGGVLGVVAER